MEIEAGYDLKGMFTEISSDIKIAFPGANENTPISWGDAVSGTCYFYFRDSNGTKAQSGKYFFNTNLASDAQVFSAPSFEVRKIEYSGSGNAPSTLLVSGQTINFNSGSFHRFHCTLPPYDSLDVSQVSVVLSTTMYTWDTTQQTPPNWRFLGGSGGAPTYTTSQAVHNASPKTPYLPVSGREMSYNDLRDYVVTEWNEQNPSETIAVDDLPEFDETETTEKATGDLQPFSLDYDEILGEKEMESIIAETRYVLDTTPYEIESVDYVQAVSEPYDELKKIAVLDADTKTAMSKIYDAAIAMTENQFLPLYAFGAILSVVMWFVFRR